MASSNYEKYPHYFKKVPAGVTHLDVYRVVEMFGVPAGPLDHALKKILCSGVRGGKDQYKDVKEARDSLNRWLQMRDEEGVSSFEEGPLIPL